MSMERQERRLREQIDRLELADIRAFEAEYGEFDDNEPPEPIYTVYLTACGADDGTWQFYYLQDALAAYTRAKKIVKEIWPLDTTYSPEEGDGAFLYNAAWGEMVADYGVM